MRERHTDQVTYILDTPWNSESTQKISAVYLEKKKSCFQFLADRMTDGRTDF